MKLLRMIAIGSLLLAASAGACKRSGGEQPEQGRVPSALSPESRAAASEMLSAYEGLRAELAADAVARLPALAERLERAAGALERGGPASLKPHAVALAAGARQIREHKEIERARMTFGEVTRGLMAILAIEPSLRQGRKVFECPMARGYKKWVQTSPRIENPYMGKAMLECGSESDWTS